MTGRWLKMLKMRIARSRPGRYSRDPVATAAGALTFLVCFGSFVLMMNKAATHVDVADTFEPSMESGGGYGAQPRTFERRMHVHVSRDDATKYFNEVGRALAASTYLLVAPTDAKASTDTIVQ